MNRLETCVLSRDADLVEPSDGLTKVIDYCFQCLELHGDLAPQFSGSLIFVPAVPHLFLSLKLLTIDITRAN
jgi:hypothetical protein